MDPGNSVESARIKRCQDCGEDDAERFYSSDKSRCIVCRKKRDRRRYRDLVSSDPEGVKEFHRNQWRQIRYNITFKQYQEILESQGHVCAICGKTERENGRRLAVDHDEKCCKGRSRSCGRCIRGLLCTDCNTSIGKFHDDPVILRKAADYIETFSRC